MNITPKKCSFLYSIKENLKAESVVFSLGVMVTIIASTVHCSLLDSILNIIRNYLCPKMVEKLSGFFSITIAMYMAVITIIATSVMGISKEFLKSKQENAIIDIFIVGIVEELSVVGISIFGVNDCPAYYTILITSIVMSVISLVKFIHLIVLIFKANMKLMVSQIDMDEYQKNKLFDIIEDIEKNTRRKNQ